MNFGFFRVADRVAADAAPPGSNAYAIMELQPTVIGIIGRGSCTTRMLLV